MRLDTLTVLNTLAAISHDGKLISLVLTLKPTTVTSNRSREHFKSALKALRIPMLVKVEAQWLESGHLHYHAHITLPSTPDTAKLLTALGIAPKDFNSKVSMVTYAYRELVKRVLSHTMGKPKCQLLQPIGGSWSAWAKYMRKDTVLPGLTNLWHFNISKPKGQKHASERHKTHENKFQLLDHELGKTLSDTQKLPPATAVPSNPKTQISDGKNRPQLLPQLNPPLNSPGGTVNRSLSSSGLKHYSSILQLTVWMSEALRQTILTLTIMLLSLVPSERLYSCLQSTLSWRPLQSTPHEWRTGPDLIFTHQCAISPANSSLVHVRLKLSPHCLEPSCKPVKRLLRLEHTTLNIQHSADKHGQNSNFGMLALVSSTSPPVPWPNRPLTARYKAISVEGSGQVPSLGRQQYPSHGTTVQEVVLAREQLPSPTPITTTIQLEAIEQTSTRSVL